MLLKDLKPETINLSPKDIKRFKYNINDITATLEVANAQMSALQSCNPKLQEYVEFKTKTLPKMVFRLITNGVKVDLEKKQKFKEELSTLLKIVEAKIRDILQEPEFNCNSSKQIGVLLRDILDITPVKDRKTKRDTFGADAMLQYKNLYPEYEPLLQLFLEYRSIKVFLATFIEAEVDPDGYMRTSYNIAGTASERLASRKNIFGRGANLQNIPAKGKLKLKYIYESFSDEGDYPEIVDDYDEFVKNSITEFPNCKEMFIPEDWEYFFDFDFSAADARIVAWTAKCKFLMDFFLNGKGDLYAYIASHYYGRKITKKDFERNIFKAIIHGTNYHGGAATLAAKAGLSVKKVREVQKFYFTICPEIEVHIENIKHLVVTKKVLENCWGARGLFLNSKDPMIVNKALAWLGSSPVSILINKILCKLSEEELLRSEHTDLFITPRLQTHDSGSGVFKKGDFTALKRIKQYADSIAVPFETPLYIPIDVKISDRSYGECGKSYNNFDHSKVLKAYGWYD